MKFNRRSLHLAGALRALAAILGAVILTGCALSAGGFRFSLLQDASVTLNTGARDGHLTDANGTQ